MLGVFVIVKNDYDREGLQAIGAIVADILETLCLNAVPGVTTGQLDQLAKELLAANGAESTPAKEYQFPGQLCISVNNEVVHGIPGDKVLKDGDLVKLDLTADKHGFVADATRMALLAPQDELAVRLSDCATRACRTAIASAKAGMEVKELGGIVEQVVHASGFEVVRDLCGHGVGRHAHEGPEVPNYFDRNNRGKLKNGSVITIEPIISAGSARVRQLRDGWTIVTMDRSLSAHYEETIVVGETGSEIITVPSPSAGA